MATAGKERTRGREEKKAGKGQLVDLLLVRIQIMVMTKRVTKEGNIGGGQEAVHRLDPNLRVEIEVIKGERKKGRKVQLVDRFQDHGLGRHLGAGVSERR
mmetsp:Transcript_41977/g.127281  ORF Transcript_41977/g.127281 Transcript_41977/m.127281 type:complete len:100 (+) Transcript_41977:225-524(+)